MKFRFLNDRRIFLHGGVGAFESKLLPLIEQGLALSKHVPLGSDNGTSFLHSLDGKARWLRADGAPTPYRNKEALLVSFFDVVMFGVGDAYSWNSKSFWRTVTFEKHATQDNGNYLTPQKLASFEHLFISSVDSNDEKFFQLAQPTDDVGCEFYGENGINMCRWLNLRHLTWDEACANHRGYWFDIPPEEHLDPSSGRWRLTGYPVTGFLFWRDCDRQSPRFLT
jgi:hypothetical protein